jgi:hypothetical protein
MRSSEVGLHDCCRQSLNCYRSLASNGAGEPRHSTSFARGVAQQHGPLSTKKATSIPCRELEIAAAVFCSSTAPSPSARPEPRRLHPLAQSRLVAIPSLHAASSPLPRQASRRRRPSSSIVAVMVAAGLQPINLDHILHLHAFYPCICRAQARLAADTAADLMPRSFFNL